MLAETRTSSSRLFLTPHLSPLGRQRWRALLENDELECYSYYLPHNDTDATDGTGAGCALFATSQLNGWYRRLHPSRYADNPQGSAWTDASYKGRLLLRKTAWHVLDDSCTCEYGYSDTWQPLLQSREMIDALEEITVAVRRAVGAGDGELNSVNLNYYPRGGGVGWHADDEFLFDGVRRKTRIVSLSLCSPPAPNAGDDDGGGKSGARKFQVKRKGKKHSSQPGELMLRHGDLMTMEGMFQRYYLHSVWPGDSAKFLDHELVQGERINLTWRTIVRHLDGTPECRGIICPLSGVNDRMDRSE